MALFSKTCPSCGEKVGRADSFCPHCGTPVPGTRFDCPHCGATVPGEAQFCPECGKPVRVSPEESSSTDAFNRWRREEGVFARRIDATELRGKAGRGLVIEPGSRALVFQAGRLVGGVEPGTYDLTKEVEAEGGLAARALRLLRRIFLGERDVAPTTAVLMDAGDVTLTVGYTDLRTSEDARVNATFQMVVRLGEPSALFQNLMHGRRELSHQELEELLSSESANTVQAHVRGVSVRELYGNTELADALEQDLRENVGKALEGYGLQLVRLKFVQFYGDAYEKARDAHEQTFMAEEMVAERERRAELRRRLRDVLTQNKMDEFASSAELEEFIRQQEHELGMKDVLRQEEMEELKRAHDQKRLEARHVLEMLEVKQKGEILQEKLKQREAVSDAELREKDKKLDFALTARGKKDELDLQRQREEQALAEEAREDEARRERERLETMQNLSEEQILALAARESPEAAKAMVERYRAQASGNEEVKELYERMVDRLERMSRESMRAQADTAAGRIGAERQRADQAKEMSEKAMEGMAHVAGARAGAQPAEAVEARCPNCNNPVGTDDAFCGHCGHKLKE